MGFVVMFVGMNVNVVTQIRYPISAPNPVVVALPRLPAGWPEPVVVCTWRRRPVVGSHPNAASMPSTGFGVENRSNRLAASAPLDLEHEPLYYYCFAHCLFLELQLKRYWSGRPSLGMALGNAAPSVLFWAAWTLYQPYTSAEVYG